MKKRSDVKLYTRWKVILAMPFLCIAMTAAAMMVAELMRM